MRSRIAIPFLVRGAIVALLAVIVVGLLLSPTPFGPGEPTAEAAFLAEVKKLLASDAEAQGGFGFSVAMSGDTAIVGAPGDVANTVYVFQRDQGGTGAWGEVKKLTGSDAENGDDFGGSVALSGDTAIVGTPRKGRTIQGPGGADFHTGAAYVFQRDEGGKDNWGEVVKLLASDFQLHALFGWSVAVSGDTVVVGARWEDVGGVNDAGAGYVFQRDEGGLNNWGEVKKLTAPAPQVNDNFGGSAAISGDTAVLGAPRQDAWAGAGYVFQRDAGGPDNWGQVKQLVASDAEFSDLFGDTVALSGDTAILGAFGEDAGGSEAGAAYIFERDAGGTDNWGEVTKLTASDAEASALFGSSVAVSGDTTVVGASWSFFSTGAGAAYLFARDEGGADNWGEVGKLIASDGEANDRFGQSLATSGDTTIVGAPSEDAGGSGAGAAYVFGPAGPGDTDRDGCTDKAEAGSNENFGGRRNNDYFWDFFDVWTHPLGQPTIWVRDKVINVPGDIIGVISRFGPGTAQSEEDALAAALTPPVSDSGYHAAFDRGPVIGPNNWDRAPADGAINIPDDILGVAVQFGHNCM